ncbi:MAG: hypothetical protein FWC75_04660 [Oscillospiraceae bacterium]|nr:hypothetical protein [Oscillospiraceae bacterium]
MKIALGMIIRRLDSEAELLNFIKNAEKFGHKLDCVIVATTHGANAQVMSSLNAKIPTYEIDINAPRYNKNQFRRLEISDKSTTILLKCPIETSSGLIPYGHNRNLVVIEALLREMDVLFFVDSDIYPMELRITPKGKRYTQVVDFFGTHLEYLKQGIQVTTGEYSGYNILPHASFDGMEDLLIGLQKEDMLEYWENSAHHECLAFAPDERDAKPCTKLLGGNVAISRSAFSKLPPLFSSYHRVENELFLNRGEDTALGIEIGKSAVTCMDVKLNPLHDTFKDFPKAPDLIGDQSVQNRFYYACTGWVGRNPFLNYLLGNDLKQVREYQRARLVPGLKALAQYTSNSKFQNVLNNFDESWNSAERYIAEYIETCNAWDEFVRKIGLADSVRSS